MGRMDGGWLVDNQIQIDPETGERIGESAAIQIDPQTGERIGQKVPEANFAQKLFPGAMQQYADRMYKPAGSLAQSAKDIGAVALAGAGDIGSQVSRTLGKWFGGTQMEDPQGGMRKDKRMADDAAFDEHIARISTDPDMNSFAKHFAIRGLQAEKLLRNGMTGLEEDPTALIGTGLDAARGAGALIKKMVPGAKDAVLKIASLPHATDAIEAMAGGGAGKAAIQAGAAETPDDLAKTVLGSINKTNAGNEAFASQANALKQGDLSSGINAASPRPNGPLPAYDAGKTLEYSVKNAKNNLGDIFKAEQERTLEKSGVADDALNMTPVSKAAAIQGLETENPAQKKVQGFLSQINYNPAVGYGVAGNRTIEPKAISALKEVYDQLGTAKTTRDILDQRRLIDNKLHFGGAGDMPLFGKGSDSEWALKQIRNSLNDVVEDQFSRGGAGIPNKRTAEAFAKAWRANNENFSTVSDALGGVIDETKNKNAEEYTKAIGSIGTDNLKKVFETAAIHKELQPVAQELRSGFVDNLISKSTKNGQIDFDAMSKNWQGMEPALKATMMTPQQIKQIDNTLARYSATAVGEPESVGKFFEGGKSDLRTASKQLENIASPDKRHALKELQFLDDLNGLKGGDRLSNRAVAMAQAKQLGMSASGAVPVVSDIRTGKFGAAAAAGAAAGAAIGSHVPVVGTALGGIAGAATGVFAQSPAGAIFATRNLNKLLRLPGASNMPLAQRVAGMASQIAGRGTGRQAENLPPGLNSQPQTQNLPPSLQGAR